MPKTVVTHKTPEDYYAYCILAGGALKIRNIAAGEKPFLYSSGTYGPGYVSIKNLVGQKELFKKLLFNLAAKITREISPSEVDFVAGNTTGGMIPGWVLSEYLELLLGREVPFVYVRDTRKKGGHKEKITGIAENPTIQAGTGMHCLVVEELVNVAETTCESAEELRRNGYKVTRAACMLAYGNSAGLHALNEHGISLIRLLMLEDILRVAEQSGIYPPELIQDYRNFLHDPRLWQENHGLQPQPEGGTI